MFIHENFSINSENHLEIGGCDCVELVKKHGSPLYVMDENAIRKNIRAYKNSIEDSYNSNGMVLFASKAFCTIAMCKLANEEGIGLDVVSGGELYTAIKAGFDLKKVYFHGNNKTYEEIEFALKNGVGQIVVDNTYELDMIEEIAGKLNTVANVLFRIKPGIDAHTHDFIRTGQIDSKFGVALENNEAYEIIKYASEMKNSKIVGIHCHIGSQIFELSPFKEAADVMTDFIFKIKDELNVEIEQLNLGGGFGIKYVNSDKPVAYGEYIKEIAQVLNEKCKEKNIKHPFVLMEPGRSIVGDAGATLYTVGAVKDIENVRKYVSIDGGMGDNPRYILYQSEYDAALANRANAKEEEVVTICGKCCESGDIIMKDAKMPKIETGDILAVMSTGAYNYSMSSNYNRIPKPPVVFVKDGNDRVVVKRETYEDIIRNDV